MDDLETRNEVQFQNNVSLLFKILLFYCAAVTLCRLFGANMRYIAYMDWTIYRKALVVRLPYYLAPFIGLFSLKWQRRSHDGLFFIAGISLIGIIDHGLAAFISIRWSLPFFRLVGNEPPVRITVLLATCSAVVFLITVFYLFRLAKRLYKQKKSLLAQWS